jgi:hypothetical protein
MNPKEKAKYLVDRYTDSGSKWYIEQSKKYALICVDEIVNIVPSVYVTQDEEIHSGHRQYWEEVKQEIQKL